MSRTNLVANLNLLHNILEDRNDYFLTTSFGYQSSIIFFIFDIMGLRPDVVFIDNGLTIGDTKKHMNKVMDRFNFNLTHIDRKQYVNDILDGRSFESLPDEEKKMICIKSKKEPLKHYIKENNKQIWVSGIRRSQTQNRAETQFLNTSDIGVIKVSPLAKFTDTDIHELSVKYSLPLNEDYKDLCKENDSRECGLHFNT